MAGRAPVTESELKKALEMLCVADGKKFSEGEDEGKKRYLLSPGDIIVRLEEGRIVTDSQSTYEKLCETLMEMRSTENKQQPKDSGRKTEEKGLLPMAARRTTSPSRPGGRDRTAPTT